MIQGVTVASADYLNTMMQWVPSAAVARTFIGLSGSSIFLLGTVTPNDGGQGLFYWDPLVSTPDDGLNVIRPPGMITGGWVRSGPSVFTGFPPTYLPPGSTTPAVCQTNYVAQGAATLQLQASTSAGAACTIFAFAYGGDLTLALLSSLDNINGGPTGSGITIPRGYSSTITNDGAGHYFATISPSAGGPATAFLNGGTTVASPFLNYVALSASTLQLPPSTSLNINWGMTVYAYGGIVTITPLSGSDVINGQAPGASITCPLGYYFKLVTDAAGHFYATVQPASIVNPGLGSAQSSFSANKSDGNQTISLATITKITFTTALFNIGSHYDTTNSRWTPPAGRVLITTTVNFGNSIPAGGYYDLLLYKNGAKVAENDGPWSNVSGGFGNYGIELTYLDSANGADYYEVYAYSGNVNGQAALSGSYFTRFQGSMI